VSLRVEIAGSIAEFDAGEWNALAGGGYPFLQHEFLHAAERTGCVAAETGWRPRHVGLLDGKGRLQAAMPLYEKTHSWGEFVFDWSWAHAYERAGLEYYPKLVSAAPFTPAPSRRLLAGNPEHAARLIEAAREFASDCGFSSVHVLFPEQRELEALRDAGMKLRKDCQFHWHNRGYVDFDDFLATFSSKKRKKVRRERRRVAEQGISFRRLSGAEMDAAIWTDVYELISMTFLRRGSLPYLSLEFFEEVSKRMPDNLLVILAEKDRQPIAAAVFYDGEDAIYGRYWGADASYNALHFETCYYQGIDYCIEKGRRRFEPGTQGEHKISRGFTPVETWSAHWLARPEFFSAVSQFLDAEKRHVDRYVDAVTSHSPYKAGEST
jgi:predicted N-acyltransferase